MAKCNSIKSLSKAILYHKEDLAASLFGVVRRARLDAGGECPETPEDADVYMRDNILTAVELAAHWARTRGEDIRTQFAGWINFCANERLNAGRHARFLPAALSGMWEDWKGILASALQKPDADWLARELVECSTVLTTPPDRELHVLFIGDCLLWDIISGLSGPCCQAGISLGIHTVSERIPAALRNRLREISSRTFDLVFYSPFSHEFSSEFAHVVSPRGMLISSGEAAVLMNKALSEVAATIDLLASLQGCPIYVHNTAAIPQHNGGLRGLVKFAAGARMRRYAAGRVARAAVAWKAAHPGRIHVVDEAASVRTHGSWKLGKVWFNAGVLHPTMLASVLGECHYMPAIRTVAATKGKKVVVCDLDNTLWDGVIGEGAVSHFTERQKTLKGLRDKGIVLSIASKNDPGNVRWNGGEFDMGDFIAPQIHWGSKVASIARIRDDLNLKTKDFIFIDDRPDERELVKAAFPEIEALDATSRVTWDILELWRHWLPGQHGEDRTQLYRERAERARFISANAGTDKEDETAAYEGLGLEMTIRHATPADIPRVVELVNRTNQFNLCGSRITAGDVDCSGATGRRVYLAMARDRFGPMGMVSVMVVDESEDRVNIPVFVLSCRVFGFGMEHAMINTVKRAAGGRMVVGMHRETAHNKPCRGFYREAGFQPAEGDWHYASGAPVEDPRWLKVNFET